MWEKDFIMDSRLCKANKIRKIFVDGFAVIKTSKLSNYEFENSLNQVIYGKHLNKQPLSD